MKHLIQSRFALSKVVMVAAICLAFQSIQASLLFTDGFNYSTGGLNASDVSPAGLSGNAWSSGSSHITVVSGNLTYAGLQNLGGNEVQDTWGISGGSVINTYTAQTSGSIYFSFLIDCTTAPTSTSQSSQFLAALNPGTGSPNGSSDALQIDVGPSGDGYQIGLRTHGQNATFAGTVLSLGTTYMVVAEYTFGPSGSAALYLNPVIGASQPTADVSLAGDGSVVSIADVGLKAQSTSAGGVYLLDNFLIGTTWADVTPQAVPEPSLLALAGVGLLGLAMRFCRACG